MEVLNRTAVSLVPREPYLQWANSLPDQSYRLEPEDARTFAANFLIPTFDTKDERITYIATRSAEMFKRALEMWNEDVSQWPKRRDHLALREWFDVEVHDLLIDLVPNEPLILEDL
jgi:hypothetical protein